MPSGLSTAARHTLEKLYATIEITDSVATMGGHQVGALRGYHDRLQQAVQELEGGASYLGVIPPVLDAAARLATLDLADASVIAATHDTGLLEDRGRLECHRTRALRLEAAEDLQVARQIS